jgi:hypothetical protein
VWLVVINSNYQRFTYSHKLVYVVLCNGLEGDHYIGHFFLAGLEELESRINAAFALTCRILEYGRVETARLDCRKRVRNRVNANYNDAVF